MLPCSIPRADFSGINRSHLHRNRPMSSAVRPRGHNAGTMSRGDLRISSKIRIVPSPYFQWKDVVGRCFALVLLVLGLPIMLVTMLAVRLTSPGPAIFRQRRVGRNGALYMMYKIRSMRQDAEAKSGPVWTT